VGKPTQNVASCVKAHICEDGGDKLDKLWEGWAFAIDIRNADSLT